VDAPFVRLADAGYWSSTATARDPSGGWVLDADEPTADAVAVDVRATRLVLPKTTRCWLIPVTRP